MSAYFGAASQQSKFEEATPMPNTTKLDLPKTKHGKRSTRSDQKGKLITQIEEYP